jgi:TolA-binding protein
MKRYRNTPLVQEAEFEKGRTFMVLNRIEEALDILISMISKYPEHPVLNKVYLNLGMHYYSSQQFENAIDAFKLVIADRSDMQLRRIAMLKIIEVYDGTRMYDAAMAVLRQYIREYPDADDILNNRIKVGTLYMKMNEYSRAIEFLREVKKDADPDSEAEIQYWIGKSYYSMGLFENAVFEYLKVRYLSKPTKLPWATSALYEAGLSYMKLEKSEQARKLFAKIVEKEGAASDWGRFAQARMNELESGVEQ